MEAAEATTAGATRPTAGATRRRRWRRRRRGHRKRAARGGDDGGGTSDWSVEATAEKAAAERAATGGGRGEDGGVEGGGGDGGGGEVYCTHARTHAAAAASAPATAEEDVDARAMRGGAAPTQRLTPLSGSSHHGEPLTAERLAGCSRLYIRQRRGGARRASLLSSVMQRVGERLFRRPLRATSRGEG